MEVTGRRSDYSEDWDTGIPCDPCLIGNIHDNAQFYCTICDEFLCDGCARNHRRSKASRQHQLLDRDEMPSKKISNVQDKLCAEHDGKLIEYFCENHDILCCSVCVTLDHGQCGVKYIDDLAKGFSSSREYKSLFKRIKDIEKQLVEDKNKRQNDSIDVTSCFRQFKADIQVFRSEINSKIDALESELLHQAEQIQNEDLKAIESLTILHNKLLLDMSEISSTLGLLEKCKQNQTLFISVKKAQMQVQEYNYKAQSMLHENSVRMYEFSRNEDILKTLNSQCKLGSLEKNNAGDRRNTKGEQTMLGLLKEDNPTIEKLNMGRQEEGGNVDGGKGERGTEQKTQNEEKTMKTDTFKSTKVKFIKDIKMNHNQDTKQVLITGSVPISNDHLAVVDYNNSSIKIVDLQADTISCYINVDGKPWDITCMDLGTLVVTCDPFLVFLLYDGKLSVVKKILMESGCKGITFSNDRLFVTFNGEHPSVKILNYEGKVLQTFKQNDEGQNLFNCPLYITVNSDGDTMFVSDMNEDTVTRLSIDGNVCSIYKHERLLGPSGLTLGDDNSIYVVGCTSHNIHQITPTCTPARIVLEQKDGLMYPYTVSYNSTDNTLYVRNSLSGDKLNVYKLK